jgi:glutamate synthase (NADPH/NADH) small chain
MALSCGAACPASVLCERACVLRALPHPQPPVAIQALERHVGEWALRGKLLAQARPPAGLDSGRKVALVGAGPASLVAAAYLRRGGHTCVIYDAHALPGGLATHGVATAALSADVAVKEAQALLGLGIELRAGVTVGETLAPEQLLADHDAVFLGLGSGGDRPLGVPGEALDGIHGARRLLERLKLGHEDLVRGRAHAVVVGGGDVAVEAAVALKRLGVAEVTVVHRSTAEAKKAMAHHVDAALREGVRFLPRHRVSGFRGETSVTEVELTRVRPGPGGVLGEAPEDVLAVPCDLVVVAVGSAGVPEVVKGLRGVEVRDGRVAVDAATLGTGNPRVFAGGAAVADGSLAHAVGDGKRAAISIHDVLLPEEDLPAEGEGEGDGGGDGEGQEPPGEEQA